MTRSDRHAARPTTIDLFCGAGGLTEGFRQAGFDCLYGNDMMPEAIDTFRHNHSGAIADNRCIEDVEPLAIRKSLGLAKGELDVLAGGPPCQGFSINAPDRIVDDPRNKLFRFYVKFLEEFSPRTFVFENVPGLLSLADGRVFQSILSEFHRLNYHLSFKILFAAHYGVPQERWRLIVCGSRSAQIDLPSPTHFAKARANFLGGRDLTFKCDAHLPGTLKKLVSVGEALGDLPRLAMGEGAEIVRYDQPALAPFAKLLRNPTGSTFNHYAAKLSRQNIERMAYIPPGGSWRDIPHDLLPSGMKRARKSDHTKRYGRLTKTGMAGTIMTKCDPHWGAVFLPDQDRTLTVREAARLQSFPDSYHFMGSRVAQYVQVGNAVPVLMAKAIAETLKSSLASVGGMELGAMAEAHG